MSNIETMPHTAFRAGSCYGRFTVLDTFELDDYHSTAVHLRHVTGLEVLHLKNDDSENLFSFAFRTPNPKANGAAHILEHSVLCGSERYPLKDPFIRLSNQSVKTYLNAMTYPDRTVFPASSIVRADYFNLMSVYGDAVFFPRLSPEAFMQEAHRLELDEHGTPSIQGVVYNEMKGSYSSFDSVAADCAFRSLVRGSVYEQDSGGDPLEIPSLTHEELVAFHKRWYRPDNCLVFLYGDIPTEEQLDFLQTNFLDRLAATYPEQTTEEARREMLTAYRAALTPAPQTVPVTVREQGPAGEEPDGKSTVLVNWLLDAPENAEQTLAAMVLSGVLLGHDGSSLQQALLESGLGEDVAPQTGLEGSACPTLLTAGLRGVRQGDEERVREVVFRTLETLARNGIPEDDIRATMHSLDYSHREIRRVHGPYSLRLMGNAVHSWAYGFGLRQGFRLRADLEHVRARIAGERGFLERLIQTQLLENPRQSLVIVTPSQDYARAREQAERALVEERMRTLSVADVRAQNDALHAFQSAAEDERCLPHVRPSDFLRQTTPLVDRIHTDIGAVTGSDGSSVPLFTNCEHTNGIIYVDVGFPADVLAPAAYALLPLFADTATECGWNTLGWAESARETALHTGGISVSLLVSETSRTVRARAYAAGKSFVGREWVVYRVSMLEEECAAALSLLADCITGTDFSDTRRLQDLVTELRNDADASVIPDGHDYAALRTKRTVSRAKAVDEIWNGLTALYAAHRHADDDSNATARALKTVHASLRAGGAFVHVTAEEKGVRAFLHELPAFIARTALTAPKPARAASDDEFFALTAIEGSGDEAAGEVLMTNAQVGFAAECIKSSPYGTHESAAEEVCAHWLSNTLLWERIRTIGGAYGAFCYTEPLSDSMVFASYRDPAPERSADVFDACLAECAERLLDDETVERAITGCYSAFVQPKTPRARGSSGLLHALYAIQDDDREEKVRQLLSLTPEDLRRAFTLLRDSATAGSRRAIICGQNVKVSGKTTVLPL